MIANNKSAYVEITNCMLVSVKSDCSLFKIHKAENKEVEEMKVSLNAKTIMLIYIWNVNNWLTHLKC